MPTTLTLRKRVSNSKCIDEHLCVYVRCNQFTFTLAGCRSQVSWGDEAEPCCAVSGHGGLIQRDDLVAEVQWAVETRTQFLDHSNDPDTRHLLNHSCRGVQLTEDDLRTIET